MIGCISISKGCFYLKAESSHLTSVYSIKPDVVEMPCPRDQAIPFFF